MRAANHVLIDLILRDRRGLLVHLLEERNHGRLLGTLLLIITTGGAVYGAVLGVWHAPLLAAYAAVKLPLLLIVTSVLTALINWLVATMLGLRIGFASSLLLNIAAIAVAATVLASLAPIAWLFTASLPGPSAAARSVHNLLYLTHVIIVATAGITGTASLKRLLSDISPSRTVARRVYVAWITGFAIVASEVAWILRPFIGSVYMPVAFLRDNAFDGNVYEFVVTDIAPYLMRRLFQ